MVAALGERAEKVRNRMVDSTEDNMLLITNDGRKLALDQRLLNPLLPDSDTGKGQRLRRQYLRHLAAHLGPAVHADGLLRPVHPQGERRFQHL